MDNTGDSMVAPNEECVVDAPMRRLESFDVASDEMLDAEIGREG